jgi:hypothetical protein
MLFHIYKASDSESRCIHLFEARDNDWELMREFETLHRPHPAAYILLGTDWLGAAYHWVISVNIKDVIALMAIAPRIVVECTPDFDTKLPTIIIYDAYLE